MPNDDGNGIADKAEAEAEIEEGPPVNDAESVMANDDETFSNIEQTEEHSIKAIEGDTNICILCKDSKQHPCRKCGINVCILFCSIPDPTSDNEMHVIHKDSTRCSAASTFECPTCNIHCKTGNELDDHMHEHHPQLSSISLVSEASSSSWTHVKCTFCKNIFMNELDLELHLQDHHNKVDLGSVINSCTICRKDFKNEWDLNHHTILEFMNMGKLV